MTSATTTAAPRVARWVTGIRLVVVAGVVLDGVSIPGGRFLALMVGFGVGIPLVVIWTFLAFGYLGGRGWRSAARDRWTVATGLLIVVTMAAVVIDLPLRARFEASRSALDPIVADLVTTPRADAIEGMEVGWYTMERVEPFEGGVRFLVADSGFLDLHGFVYAPGGEPPNIGGEDSYAPFVDGWWLWRESW